MTQSELASAPSPVLLDHAAALLALRTWGRDRKSLDAGGERVKKNRSVLSVGDFYSNGPASKGKQDCKSNPRRHAHDSLERGSTWLRQLRAELWNGLCS
jgi:hypothetical protein